MAHGGEAVGRAGGKAVFVAGALPGELVEVEVIEDRRSWTRGRLTRVVEASSERIDPACAHFGSCGGCQWQFADRVTQAGWKRSIVVGQLRHLGGISDPDVREPLLPGPGFGYRNRMDFRVLRGRPALHGRRTRELEVVDGCTVLSPPLKGMLEEMGDLGPFRQVTVRAGAATGDRLAIVSGRMPESADWSFPVCTVGRGRPEVIRGAPSLTEIVDGTRFRITASAFFQNNTAGAEALVGLVRDALEVTADDTLLDAYAGGGLFGLTAGREAGRIIAVETARMAVDDLLFNAEAAGLEVEIAGEGVEAGIAGEWTVVVCDPPRSGLGAAGVASVTRTDPRVIAYVACDPASLARDARSLEAAGYRLDYATPVDMFPQTYHIETVARFVRW